MEKHTLSASKRTVLGRKVKKLRQSGLLPANVYGKKISSQAVQVNRKDFETVFSKAGETTLVDLKLEKKTIPVLIHNIAYDPIDTTPLHADFYQVDLKEKVTTKVPVVVTGESPAVRDKIGVVLTIVSEVEVEALPQDLLEKIEVDVSKLTQVDSSIKVGELSLSEKVKVLTEANLDVVKIAPLISKEAEALTKQEAEAAALATSEAQATMVEGEKREEVKESSQPQETPPATSSSEAKKQT